MGGPWQHPTDSPLINAYNWGYAFSVEYGAKHWPSRSERMHFWEAE